MQSRVRPHLGLDTRGANVHARLDSVPVATQQCVSIHKAAALNHSPDPPRVANVQERVRVEDDEVRNTARRDRAKVLLGLEDASGD
jgi:hypothetical protein